jgi:hypothetical protein
MLLHEKPVRCSSQRKKTEHIKVKVMANLKSKYPDKFIAFNSAFFSATWYHWQNYWTLLSNALLSFVWD